jgi:hypothetical protein
MSNGLISIHDAVKAGISKLRQPKWSNPQEHIEITIVVCQGTPALGPWFNLYSPMNMTVHGKDPVQMSMFNMKTSEKVWEEYKE